jgi:hypothetical protein
MFASEIYSEMLANKLSFKQWLLDEYESPNLPWVTDFLDNGQESLLSLFRAFQSSIASNHGVTDQFLWGQLKKFQGAMNNIRASQKINNEVNVLEKMHEMQTVFQSIYNDLNDRGRRMGKNSPYPHPEQTAVALRKIIYKLKTTFDTQTASPADSGQWMMQPNPRL